MKPIVVRNLTKDYKIYSRRGQKFKEMLTLNRREYHETKRALSDISFSVEEGECLGVIGDNGSGKSTLLKIIARTSYPTAGELEINGEVSYILDPSTGFNPDFSGRENVHIKCALLGLTSEQTAALFPVIHQFSGLEERIDHPIKTYSTGMVVRLGFSVAIHVPFDVLLVDEVLSVGDYLFQRKCINAIRAFKAQGKTILISSHSLSDVATFCDRLIMLSGGKLSRLGRTDEVVQAYIEECEACYSRIESPDLPIRDDVLTCCDETLGQVAILAVSFFNDKGEETTNFRSGAGMTLRVRFLAEQEVENPCLRIQFLRNDGLLVTGSNTYRHNLKLEKIKGHYEALCHFEHLNILDGDYYANVGIWPDEYQSFVSKRPYDIHEYKYIITMSSERADGGGLALSPASWKLNKLEDFK